MLRLVTLPTVTILTGSFEVLINLLTTAVFTFPIKLIRVDSALDAFLYAAACAAELASVVGVILSILLIIGVVKKRYECIEPYLYFRFIGLNFFALAVIVIMFGCMFHRAPFPFLTECILLEGLQIAVWFPAYVLYKMWKADNETNQNQTDARNDTNDTHTNYVPL